MASEHKEEAGSDYSDNDYDDPYSPPSIQLPEIDVETLEEDEEVLWKHRGQLYRFDMSEEPAVWKQRGTGVLKLLKHKNIGYVRLLMRRDGTLKVCANHYVLPDLELKPHEKSERTWVWFTPADFADEVPKMERLAVRFRNKETFDDFYKHMEIAKSMMGEFRKKVLDSAKANEVTCTKEEEKSSGEDEKLVQEVEALKVD